MSQPLLAQPGCDEFFSQYERLNPPTLRTRIRDILQLNLRAKDRVRYNGPEELAPIWRSFIHEPLFRWYLRRHSGDTLEIGRLGGSRVDAMMLRYREYVNFKASEPDWVGLEYWKKGRLVTNRIRNFGQYVEDIKHDPWRLLFKPYDPTLSGFWDSGPKLVFHPWSTITRSPTAFAFIPHTVVFMSIAMAIKAWKQGRQTESTLQILDRVENAYEYNDIKRLLIAGRIPMTEAVARAWKRYDAIKALYDGFTQAGVYVSANSDMAVNVLIKSSYWKPIRDLYQHSFFNNNADYQKLASLYARFYVRLNDRRKITAVSGLSQSQGSEQRQQVIEKRNAAAADALTTFLNDFALAFADYPAGKRVVMSGFLSGVLGRQLASADALLRADDDVIKQGIAGLVLASTPLLDFEAINALAATRQSMQKLSFEMAQQQVMAFARVQRLKHWHIVDDEALKTLVALLATYLRTKTVDDHNKMSRYITDTVEKQMGLPKSLIDLILNSHRALAPLAEKRTLYLAKGSDAVALVYNEDLWIIGATRVDYFSIATQNGFGQFSHFYEVLLKQMTQDSRIREVLSAYEELPIERSFYVSLARQEGLYASLFANDQLTPEIRAQLIEKLILFNLYLYELPSMRGYQSSDWRRDWQEKFEATKAFAASLQ